MLTVASEPPRRPVLPPPERAIRPRMGSADSFRAVAPDERELILREIRRIDDRLKADLGELKEKVTQHDEDIRDLRAAMTEWRASEIETRALRHKVEQLLGADVSHDARLALLEAQRAGIQAQATAELAGAEAKDSARATSRRWSAVGSVIGTVIAAAVAAGIGQCSQPPEKPQPTYNPRR